MTLPKESQYLFLLCKRIRIAAIQLCDKRRKGHADYITTLHWVLDITKMAPSPLTAIYDFLSLGNVFLLFISLLMLHYFMVLFEFRNMPPGPRFTTIPVLGNLLSLDPSAETLSNIFKRYVIFAVGLRKSIGFSPHDLQADVQWVTGVEVSSGWPLIKKNAWYQTGVILMQRYSRATWKF